MILKCVLILQINIRIWFAWRASIEGYKYWFKGGIIIRNCRNMSTVLNYNDKKEKNNDFSNLFLHEIWWNKFIKARNSIITTRPLSLLHFESFYGGCILIIPRFYTIHVKLIARKRSFHYILSTLTIREISLMEHYLCKLQETFTYFLSL